MNIGIYSVSSQSGRAFMADMMSKTNLNIYGYARASRHGSDFITALHRNGGLYLERPQNKNNESSTFLPFHALTDIGHDLNKLIEFSDVIYIAHPSNFLPETAQILKDAGITEKRIPLITAPPRSFATPYLWKILGEMYPIVSFSTCPYSCKAPNPGVAYIKRRKRTWFASLEGTFTQKQIEIIESIFPQVVYNHIPLTTSIGNIGAVFHPSTYLLNFDAIKAAEDEGRVFSFYMEGIYQRPEVGKYLEDIDQVRLQIADRLDVLTFGLKEKPREEEWAKLTAPLYEESVAQIDDIMVLRKIRHDCLANIGNAVPSAQHWLDYTYGVRRIPGETLSNAIGRTPTYQKQSVPQLRYVTEDVPSSLVPLSAMARRLDIDASPLDKMIALYKSYYGSKHKKDEWRDLTEFSTDYLIDYLKGKFFKVV